MGVTVYCKIRLDEASEGDLRARLEDGVELIQGEMSDQAMAADVFVDPHP
ncbi:MAG: hypothetical protein GF320_22285, partial [Armatimonadia bacterium]|nr:hypothetical protein [Armatimonadia bacterium]